MYLWNILKQNQNELIRKVFKAQKLVKTKGDWFDMINKEREKYGIEETEEEISKMSKSFGIPYEIQRK